MSETIQGYRFQPADLKVNQRRPGISAFMRIKNGADWLEVSIRSHMRFFDEIVAVYNQCTDATPEILDTLQKEFGADRLRVIHYVDAVHPPGSAAHATTAPGEPSSLVNYYNFALASTGYQYATKLDDDHLAVADMTSDITDRLRRGEGHPDTMYCFSGLNLFRNIDGQPAVLRSDPVSGGGDIGFFRVTGRTLFTHDRRFERFQRGGQRRQFAGFLYWHLKYLKRDMGFGNYEIERNPNSRYAKRRDAFMNAAPTVLSLDETRTLLKPDWRVALSSLFSGKSALIAERNRMIASSFPDASVKDAILRTTDAEFHPVFFADAGNQKNAAGGFAGVRAA